MDVALARPAGRGGRSTELLGLPPDARVLILNLDDFGMYRAVNVAVIRSIEDGIAGSCSLMVPCPGARHALRLLRERPEIPFGIHLTLVCDTTASRWGPLAGRRQVPSLLDGAGEFFRPDQVPDLLAQARPEHVEIEFRRQIDAVVDAGLTPTHLDWHCLADGGRDDILELTLALADEYGLALRAWLDPARRTLRERGLPVLDHDFLDSFRLDLAGKAARFAALLRGLPVGLSEWAVHPGLGDGEARAIDPGWRVRRADYEFLVSPHARQIVRDEHIVVTDYRPIQQLLRPGQAARAGLPSSTVSFTADPRVDAYIDALPGWQQAVCRQVRDLVHGADPDVVETVKRTDRPYFVLDGNICALLATEDHVDVVLYDGAIVPDPEGIITGGHDNKTARTVAVHEGETVNASALSAMFRQIIADNRAGGWRRLKDTT